MTQFSKDEPFIISLDFDGTLTTNPFPQGEECYSFPPIQKGFEKFYEFIHQYNIDNEDKIYLVINTARNLDNDKNWNYIKDYIARYRLNEIYMPKRDGKTMKNNLNDKTEFPVSFASNSKLPCSMYIDDLNVCIPKLKNGELNWKKITKSVLNKIEELRKKWY